MTFWHFCSYYKINETRVVSLLYSMAHPPFLLIYSKDNVWNVLSIANTDKAEWGLNFRNESYNELSTSWELLNLFFFPPEIMKASLRIGLMNSASMLGIHCSESLPQSPLTPRKWNFTGSFCYKFLGIFWWNQTYKKSSAGLSLSIETNPKHIIFKNFPVEKYFL